MKREHWQNGQIVLTNDLSWAQESKEQAILERVLDLFDTGILDNSQFGVESYPFAISPGDTNTTITVHTGVAIGPTGERIVIDSLINYSDGNTSLVPPISSGSKNIPLQNLAANKPYWVWIRHFNTKDPSVFTIASDGYTKIYTKGLDGYEIRVNETSADLASSGYVFLAKVTTTPSAVVNLSGIDISGRRTAKVKENRIGITVDTSNRPATYANGEKKYLQDHIAAIGSGTVAPNNPHGLTPEDLGLTAIEGLNHQSRLHSNGIFTTEPASVVSALYPYVYTPSEDVNDYILVKKLSESKEECAVVNGKTLTAASMSSDVAITFTAAPEFDGKYYIIYVDGSDLTIKKSSPFDDDTGTDFTNFLKSRSILPICSIQWKKDPSPGNPDNYDLVYSTLKDWRSLGTTSTLNIKPHIIGGLWAGAAIGNRVDTFYRGRIENSLTDGAYAVAGLTFSVRMNGSLTTRSVTFTGIDPLPVNVVLDQINSSDIGLNGGIAYLTKGGHVCVMATKSLQIMTGTANAALGFAESTSDTSLKEVVSANDFAGRSVLEYDAYDRISIITCEYGNKVMRQTIEYLDATPDSDIKSITEEIIG